MRHARPCSCGESSWACHGMGDAMRALAVNRTTIQSLITRYQLGTHVAGRIHLSAAEFSIIARHLQTTRDARARTRHLKASRH